MMGKNCEIISTETVVREEKNFIFLDSMTRSL